MAKLQPCEHAYLTQMIARLTGLRQLLEREEMPVHETSPAQWHTFLYAIKSIVGNANNDVSFIASLMAKEYLLRVLPILDFDIGLKPQGAPGLDIDVKTVDGRRVVAEIKTTSPYHPRDLGAQQKVTFKKDFAKLNAAHAERKFFFLTDRTTFDIVCARYIDQLHDVQVVLLPSGLVADGTERITRKGIP